MNKSASWILTLSAVALLALAGAGCTAKMKTSYHLKRAERYFDAGQYAQAEIEYKNVLRHAPENAEAWDRLGLIFFNQGRAPEALPILLRAEQLDASNLDVRLKLGAIYLGIGKLKEARDETSFVLERRPQDGLAPILLAETATTPDDIIAVRQRLQQMQQKGDSAALEVAMGTLALRQRDSTIGENDFNRAAALDPKFSDAYSALGSLYVMQKDLKRADNAFQKAAELAPPWSGNGVRYAQFKILTGDTGAGEHLLQDVVKKDPDYVPAWMALSQLAAAENNYTNSVALLGNVLSRDPENFEGLLFQGRLELLQGQTNQAVIGLERMAKMYPQAPPVYYALAQACLANNQTNEANANLTQALSLNPKYADAILLLAETQIRNGDTASAIVSLRQLVQQQPRVVQGWVLLADAYRAQGTLAGAVQIYQELEKSYPKNPQIPVLLGETLSQQHENVEARAEFEKALQLSPDYLPALEQLVNLDLTEKQYSAALQRVQQIEVKNPNEAALQLLLGKTLAAQGETNQAESAFSKAITLQPGSQAAYLLLAQLYIMTGQNQKALDDLQTGLDKDPKNIAAMMFMGMIYNSEKEYDKARDAYEKLLAVDANNGMALNNLACVYADHLDELNKADPLARQARNVAPTDPSIADTLGWILYREGQYTLALPLLRESAGKLYAVPEVQFHLGMACYMTGNETEARTALQRALQLTGDFPEKDQDNQYLAILNIDANRAGADTRDWLEKWTASHTDDPVALSRLAGIYLHQGMTARAISAYESVLKDSPQNVNALVNLARLYAPTDASKAYAFAKSAYQLTPADPEVTHLFGHLAFLTGDYSWALTLLQLTAQAQPQNPEVLYDLGEAFYSMGRVAEARTAMRNALQTGIPFARTNDASQFLAMTALTDTPARALAAQSQVAEILKSNPDDVPALMVKALIAGQKADPATAQQIYEDVLKRYPDFAPAQKQLAILYAKDPANDTKAYPLAVKALQAFPGDAEVAKSLGMIMCRQGDYARAAGLLQESASQITQDPELLYFLGLAQFHLKQGAQSKATLQRALALNLAGAQAADARQMLAALK